MAPAYRSLLGAAIGGSAGRRSIDGHADDRQKSFAGYAGAQRVRAGEVASGRPANAACRAAHEISAILPHEKRARRACRKMRAGAEMLMRYRALSPLAHSVT